MSEPAFARPAFWTEGFGDVSVSQKGMSQRRLLAGMILNGIVCGLFANPQTVGWTVEGNVKAALQYADELIRQTEET